MHRVTKTYGNERGLSCCFRQFKADSHCALLHGYSLGVEITLESNILTEQNWVYDFGKFKAIEKFLKQTFDHTTIVSVDDPLLSTFEEMHIKGLVNIIIFNGPVGCEAFAKHISDHVESHLHNEGSNAYVISVKVFEHSSNSATYFPNNRA